MCRNLAPSDGKQKNAHMERVKTTEKVDGVENSGFSHAIMARHASKFNKF